MQIQTAAWVAAISVWSGCGAQSADTKLEPAWTHRSGSRIEWIDSVGENPGVVVVGMSDGALDVLGGGSGKSLLEKPHALRAGVRMAEPFATGAPESADPAASAVQPALFYCYDRFSVYAIDAKLGTMRWERASPPSDPETLRGDPEHVPRISLAAVAPGGVLVCFDGKIGLLSRDDGSLRWKLELSPTPIHPIVRIVGQRAAIVWNAKGATAAAFVELGTGVMTQRAERLDDVDPFWFLLRADGLVMADARGFRTLRPDGKIVAFDNRGEGPFRSAITVAYRDPQSDYLVAASGAADGLIAFDLNTLKSVWTVRWRTRKDDTLAQSGRALSLLAEGPWVVSVHRGSVVVHQVSSGHTVRGFQFDGEILGTSDVRHGIVWSLFQSGPRGKLNDGAMIAKLPLEPRLGDPKVVQISSATETVSNDWSVAALSFEGAPDVTHFCRGMLLLAAENRLEAYTLP